MHYLICKGQKYDEVNNKESYSSVEMESVGGVWLHYSIFALKNKQRVKFFFKIKLKESRMPTSSIGGK